MSKIIKPLGDGKKKILSPEEAMRQLDSYQPPKPQTPKKDETANGLPKFNPSYLKVEWELQSPKATYQEKKTSNEKSLFTFDTSLARLKAAGYDRHPTPSEHFSLVMAYLEGKLADPKSDVERAYQQVAKDMLDGPGEWLSMAMKREKEILFCYANPHNLKWDEPSNEYVIDGERIEFDSVKTFDVKNFPSKTPVNLEDVPDDVLIFYLYGRGFDDFPERARKGDLQGQLTLPSKGTLCPVSCSAPWRLYIDGRYGHFRASRGVREIK